MRTIPALAALAFLSFVACSDATSPSRRLTPGSQANGVDFLDCDDPESPCYNLRGFPPPPYRDTMAVALNTDGSALTGAPMIRVQYFVNKTDNNGWIMFRGQTSGGVLASPDAKLSVHKNSLSGKGTLQLFLPGATLTIDLSKNLGKAATFLPDCSKTCGSFSVSGATLTPKVGSPSSFSGVIVIAPPATIIGPD
jgi:hypothetical protein